MKPVAHRYTDSFGTHFTTDKREVLDTPGVEEWSYLYESDATELVDLYIRPLDERHVWIGSLQEPGEGGAFCKEAVNEVLRKLYNENI